MSCSHRLTGATDDASRSCKRRLEELLGNAGVAGAAAVLTGSGVEVIEQYAETTGAQLVVVGTHGRSGFKRLTAA
jgi:nucleotide-binding universal stress UspA family protein